MKFYKENGYVILDNLFSIEETESIKDLLEQHTTQDYNNILNPDRYEFLIAQSYDKFSEMKSMREKIGYINTCKNTSDKISLLLKDRRIVKVLESLYNQKFVGLSTHMIWKKPDTPFSNQAWAPHQDNSYAKNKNGLLVTINLFLDDTTKENGCIYNYPKSHTEGLLDYSNNVSWGNNKNPGNEVEVSNKYKKNDVVGKKGDVYIQHGNLIHGSYPNVSKSMRGMYSATYIVEGESFESGYNAMRKVIKI